MVLNLKEWGKVLNSVEINGKVDIIEQIAGKLKNTEKLKYKVSSPSYEDWKRNRFDINHPLQVEYYRYESLEEFNDNKFDTRCPFYMYRYRYNKHLMGVINLPLLFIAASNGNLEVVRYLISKGANVNVKIHRGYTLLHSAAENGHLDVIHYLVSKGANVNVKGHRGYTPLHSAVENGDLEMVHYLVSKGANVNEMDDSGYTPFLLAAKNGHERMVKILLPRNDLNVKDTFGRTSLRRFAECGDLEMVHYLVSKGANVNEMDDSGYTPFLLAAKNGHERIVKILLPRNDLNVKNTFGCTSLHRFVECGDLEMVHYLVSKGANVNATNNYGETPLHRAAARGYTDIINTLIDRGADINAKSNYGETPLHKVVERGNTDTINALIDRGADIDAKDGLMGRTPLHRAVEKDNTDTIEPIVNHIAKLEVAGLYVSEINLRQKNGFINTSGERRNNYLRHCQNCEEEAKKIGKENKPLCDFLKESNIDELTSIWERNEGVRSKFDNQESLQKEYPEYDHILINKASEVKREIFLHNHKPLVDALSTHYVQHDFQTITLAGMENLFGARKNDFKAKEIGCTLINFVDFEDITERHIPKLKVQGFANHIKSNVPSTNFESPSAGQIQGVSQALLNS